VVREAREVARGERVEGWGLGEELQQECKGVAEQGMPHRYAKEDSLQVIVAASND
jgi:hypothetical protein